MIRITDWSLIRLLSILFFGIASYVYVAWLPNMTDQTAWILFFVLMIGTSVGRELSLLLIKIPLILVSLVGWVLILDGRRS